MFAYLSHFVYKKVEDNSKLSFKDAYLDVVNNKKLELMIAGGVLYLIPLVLICTLSKTAVMLGLVQLVTTFVLTFVSLILVPAIFVWIEDSKANRLTQNLSRNKTQKKSETKEN